MSQAPTPQIDSPTLGWFAALAAALAALGYLVKLGTVLGRLDQAAKEIADLAVLMKESARDRAVIHEELGQIRADISAIKERHKILDTRREGDR